MGQEGNVLIAIVSRPRCNHLHECFSPKGHAPPCGNAPAASGTSSTEKASRCSVRKALDPENLLLIL